nr:immunoglobulin heavy chain junction region [Macaca mulatta]
CVRGCSRAVCLGDYW